MNKLQAMAKTMALLGEDGNLKPGNREYAITRKSASKTIDQPGPVDAVNNVERRKASLPGQIYILKELEASGTRLPPLGFQA